MSVPDAREPSASAGPAAGSLRPIADVALWLIPPVLCFAVYWPGLWAWFQADDFAWLALRLDVHDWHSLERALFAPMAQGTIRPFSERAFFLVFESLFGLHALPFRICVFLTQCANLTLLAAVTRRLTGSRAAGLWAAVLWAVNSSLVSSMVWSSTFNQVLCGFFLLGAFWFLLRYVETGRTSDYLWQWVLFLLGFGALEVNVVYPALAATFTFLVARKFFPATLALFIPSAAFTLVHRMVAPAHTAGAYALHFDRALAGTFATYWQWALISEYPSTSLHGRLEFGLFAILTIALLTFAIIQSFRHDWIPVFCLAWFVIVLAPVLPLRDHVSDYYLTLPTIGLAMLGAYGLVRVWRKPMLWKLAAVTAATAYMTVMVQFDRTLTPWWASRSWAVERMVLGVARGHQLHPNKAIVLDGVDSQLFWAGVFHHPFRLYGVSNVYLTPGSEAHIEAHDATGQVSDFILPNGPAVYAAKSDRIVVYRVGFNRLKAITSSFEQAAIAGPTPEVPRKVDAGNPLMGYLLGPEWYPPENGARWMPRRATLRIGGSKSVSERLYVEGFLPLVQIQQPPILLRVTVDNVDMPETSIQLGENRFSVSFPLPNEAVGKSEHLIGLEVGRTSHYGTDVRELGLNFGTFEIR